MCSNILPGMGTREVGLRSETFFELATFGIGIASFHSEGTLQVSWLVLNRKVNSTIINHCIFDQWWTKARNRAGLKNTLWVTRFQLFDLMFDVCLVITSRPTHILIYFIHKITSPTESLYKLQNEFSIKKSGRSLRWSLCPSFHIKHVTFHLVKLLATFCSLICRLFTRRILGWVLTLDIGPSSMEYFVANIIYIDIM